MNTKKYMALMLCGGVMGSMITFLSFPFFTNNITQKYINVSPTNSVINIEGQTTDNIYKAIIAKAMPSVVGVTTVSQSSLQELINNESSTGVGTGVIIDPRGYIITNSHVVNDGSVKEVNVTFSDSTIGKAEVLWVDKHMDLAVIKVDAEGLVAAELGDSDTVEVGDISVAIGNPLGLELQRSVTEGIISGLNRSVRVKNADGTVSVILNLMQTSAAINFGNSGGPLLNDKGQLIGINTAKAKEGEGLGFAIPINEAKPIIEQFIEEGTFKKVVLGVTISNVAEYQEMTGADFGIESGVIIIKIEPDSVAKINGLLVNDVIVKINNEKIENKIDLFRYLYKVKTGDSVKMTVWRENKYVTLDVKF